VISILDALRLLLSLGVSLKDVSQLASTNPALLLGLSDECGSLSLDHRADLVALSADHRPQLTLVGGHVAFQRNV